VEGSAALVMEIANEGGGAVEHDVEACAEERPKERP
jgi:hypothetical protein